MIAHNKHNFLRVHVQCRTIGIIFFAEVSSILYDFTTCRLDWTRLRKLIEYIISIKENEPTWIIHMKRKSWKEKIDNDGCQSHSIIDDIFFMFFIERFLTVHRLHWKMCSTLSFLNWTFCSTRSHSDKDDDSLFLEKSSCAIFIIKMKIKLFNRLKAPLGSRRFFSYWTGSHPDKSDGTVHTIYNLN